MTEVSADKKISPLLHDVVIRKIFNYLNLGDVKACRQVCSRWRYASYTFFQQCRFRFKFIASTVEEIIVDEMETEKINIFLENFENVPTVTFTLAAAILPNHANLLTDIIDRQNNNIKSLIINTGTNFSSSQSSELVDISEAVSAGDLTSLSINCKNISISMASIKSIPQIYLYSCTILLPDERIPFVAKNLKFSCPNFQKDGEIIGRVTLDDFLEFKNLKALDLAYTFRSCKTKCISLGMKSNYSLDSLTLFSVSGVTDWSFQSLTVKKLKLTIFDNPSPIPDSVHLQELQLDCILNQDINIIPLTLKRLIISGNMFWPRNTDYQILPNLNYLKVYYCGQGNHVFNFSFLKHFGNALPNLSQLEVATYGSDRFYLETQVIPQTVQQIKLVGNVQFCRDDRFLLLESLILVDYETLNMDELLSKYFKPKSVVFKSNIINLSNSLDKFHELLEESKCERIIAGEFVSRHCCNGNRSKVAMRERSSKILHS